MGSLTFSEEEDILKRILKKYEGMAKKPRAWLDDSATYDDKDSLMESYDKRTNEAGEVTDS